MEHVITIQSTTLDLKECMRLIHVPVIDWPNWFENAVQNIEPFVCLVDKIDKKSIFDEKRNF